jgi:hypothetical protein
LSAAAVVAVVVVVVVVVVERNSFREGKSTLVAEKPYNPEQNIRVAIRVVRSASEGSSFGFARRDRDCGCDCDHSLTVSRSSRRKLWTGWPGREPI